MASADAKVAVITTLGCPYCKKTKAALQAASIPFQEYELSEQLEALSKIKAATGQSTVPQVFVGGKLLGGASEVVPLVESGELARLLDATQAPALPQDLQPVIAQAVAGSADQVEADPAQRAQQEELRQLAEDLRAARLGPGGTTSPFTLPAAADSLASRRGWSAEEAAAALGKLQAAQLLTVVDGALSEVPITPQLTQQRPEVQLQFPVDAPQPTKWREPLNGHVRWFGPARPAAEVAESLRKRILLLFDKHLQAGGKKVDYAAMRADPAFKEFAAAAAELQKVDLSQLSTREQRLAFLINTYNALVVHALTVFGPADGSLGRLRWFDNISYLIGGARWTSNDIEHGALRGNAPSPASLFALLGRPQWAGKTFKAGDPRAALAIKPVDPRIHFALNCGAASCPPVRVYTPERLEFGLEAAASGFCESEVVVDKAAGELELSMIFKWYGGDFGSKAQLLQFIADHLPPGPQAELRELLRQKGAEGVKLRYRPYDWTTNAAE